MSVDEKATKRDVEAMRRGWQGRRYLSCQYSLVEGEVTEVEVVLEGDKAVVWVGEKGEVVRVWVDECGLTWLVWNCRC